MKFNVTAQAHSRTTGQPTGPVRTEKVDTEQNQIFLSVDSTCLSDRLIAVARLYESFWNGVNCHSPDIVFVSRVVPA